jgi:hypothetical protein
MMYRQQIGRFHDNRAIANDGETQILFGRVRAWAGPAERRRRLGRRQRAETPPKRGMRANHKRTAPNKPNFLGFWAENEGGRGNKANRRGRGPRLGIGDLGLGIRGRSAWRPSEHNAKQSQSTTFGYISVRLGRGSTTRLGSSSWGPEIRDTRNSCGQSAKQSQFRGSGAENGGAAEKQTQSEGTRLPRRCATRNDGTGSGRDAMVRPTPIRFDNDETLLRLDELMHPRTAGWLDTPQNPRRLTETDRFDLILEDICSRRTSPSCSGHSWRLVMGYSQYQEHSVAWR